MALSQNTQRPFEIGDINEFPVLASAKLYEGALATIQASSGYARPCSAGDAAVGFVLEPADNTGGASGAINVRVREWGKVQLSIAALAITDVDKPVFASDDGTFTLTATGNTFVGIVSRWVSTGVGVVEFDFRRGRAIVALTDNSGGTAADTIAAIGAAYSQAEVRNAIASLAAKLNLILATLK